MASSVGSRTYSRDTSIVLVGIRGTGKSTLAVMVASSLGYRLIDSDQHFYNESGLSRAAYKAAHGLKKYRHTELRQLRTILCQNKTRAVIVCGPGAVEGTGRIWLSSYAASHPVLYILRDPKAIRKCLGHPDGDDLVSRLIRLSSPVHRSISSFEFYNICDPVGTTPDHPAGSEPSHGFSPKSLALKQVERDFLQLVTNVTNRFPSAGYQLQGTASQLPPLELRPYTYALMLPASTLDRGRDGLRDLETTADAIELVMSIPDREIQTPTVDHSILDSISRRVYLTRRLFQLPVIFNPGHHPVFRHADRRPTDGCSIQTTSEPYFEILHHALRLAPDYLCVEIESDVDQIHRLAAAKGPTKLLADMFIPHPGPDGWQSDKRWDAIRTAKDLGFDLIRISQPATTAADGESLKRFIERYRLERTLDSIPLIAYNIGSGLSSSYLSNNILTPVTTTALRELCVSGLVGGHSLPTLQEAQRALYSTGQLQRRDFGIYGNDGCSYSLSPPMQTAAFAACGMPHTYPYHVEPSLQPLRELIRQGPSFGGLSITAPYKREVLALVDVLSPEASAIGAVNTLLPIRDSHNAEVVTSILGDNTDWIGIGLCARRNLSPINAVKNRTSALVIGAGGVARAGVYALIRLGVRRIYVLNRTLSRAENVATEFNRRFGGVVDRNSSTGGNGSGNSSEIVTVLPSKQTPWPKGVDKPTIIVSAISFQETTSRGNVDNTLPVEWLASPTGGVAIELAYAPRDTPLVKQMRNLSESGWITVDGLQTLPEQGAVQFELFTGRKAPRKLMMEQVLLAYEKRMSSQNGVD